MRVPLSPRMAAGACSSEAMTARRRQPLRTNCTAAATFGCIEPAPDFAAFTRQEVYTEDMQIFR